MAVTASGVLAGVSLFQISSGQLATCAQDTTGAFYCWGTNTSGQLGNASTTSSDVPVAVQAIVFPGPPTGVSTTPGDTTATISWTAPASLGSGTLTGYTATATASSGTFTCTTTSAVTCVITGLTDGTTYSVTVVALSTVGNSPPSSPAVDVEPVGILALTSPTSLTWAATGTGLNQSVVDGSSGDQQLTATDNTETGAGWHVTVSATTFTTGPRSLPDTGAVDFTGSVSSSLATTAPSATCVGSCILPTDTTTYPVVVATGISSPTAYTVYDTSASTGEGVMTIGGGSAANPIGWWVQVPAATYAGAYASAVTLEVVSGPLDSAHVVADAIRAELRVREAPPSVRDHDLDSAWENQNPATASATSCWSPVRAIVTAPSPPEPSKAGLWPAPADPLSTLCGCER